MTDTPERALLRRLSPVLEMAMAYKGYPKGPLSEPYARAALLDLRALLAQPAAEGRRWQSDLTVDQHLLCDNSGAGKVTVDPALLSPSPHLSRAEVEAMVEKLDELLDLVEHHSYVIADRDARRAEIVAALLRALTGEGT